MRDSAQFGWSAYKSALVGWPPWLVGWPGFPLVSLIQVHLWSWPVRGYDNPHHGHQSTTAYGYQALPIVVFLDIGRDHQEDLTMTIHPRTK